MASGMCTAGFITLLKSLLKLPLIIIIDFLINTTEHKQLAWHYETTSTFTLHKLHSMELMMSQCNLLEG
jgi:hypothetical protein